jgi:hypothetical protein
MSASERIFQWLARVYFVVVVALGSLYLLLANVAVANQWIVRSPLFNWIPVVVRWYPAAYLSAAVVVAWALMRFGRASGLWSARVLAFAVAQVAIAASLQVFSVLSNPVPGPVTLIWSFALLGSLVWTGVVDFSARNETRAPVGGAIEGPSFRAAVLAAAIVAVGYFFFGPAKEVVAGNPVVRWSTIAVLSLSVLAHLALFLLFYVIAVLSWKVSGWMRPELRLLFAVHLMAALLGFVLFRQIVLPSLLFTGWLGDIYALAFPFAISFYIAAARLRLSPERTTNWLANRNAWQQAAIYLPALALAAFALTRAVPVLDWNFLFQKIGVFIIWSAAFYVLHRLCRAEKVSVVFTVVVLAVGIGGLHTFAAVTQSGPFHDIALTTYFNQAVADYLKHDSSFHALRDLSRGSRINVSSDRFYKYLLDNTNVPMSMRASAPETSLVDTLKKTESPRPNIFLFVVDSLRPDYLSPYNKAVRFTPSIESFAAESVVFPNAFTQYGGTALAEPAIWTGTLQFHQQFISSFAPINSLKKLVEADGYESWVSVDLVMSVVLDPAYKVKRLSQNVKEWDELDLCDIVSEVATDIDSRQNSKTPLFAFAQAQNTHQVSIERRQRTPPPPYPGFEARTAFEVEKLDRCFGSFIRHLKAKGIYDNSIVILTSDHGDEFFEHGNFGHVGSLFPEVLRVPLLIHLPSEMRNGLVIDQRSASFTTDITPSLYYLLGHRQLKKNQMFGRSLFGQSLEELRASESAYYMVASSYAPIYGILDQWGESLYISDALNRENYLFDLAHDPQAKENKITFAEELKNESLISHEIDAIADFYHFKGRKPAPDGNLAVAAAP